MSFTDWMPSWLRASLHDIRSVKPAAPMICPTDHFCHGCGPQSDTRS